MTSRIGALSLAIALGASLTVALATPAFASTTDYVCPTSAGAYQMTGGHQHSPSAAAANPITDLIGCATPYTPAQVSGWQPLKNVATYYDALPASAFAGDVITVRVVGTPDNYGYTMSMWVNKDTEQSAWNSPDYVKTDGPVGVSGQSSPVEITVDFAITVTDPVKKAQILAGDFVIQLNGVGGIGAGMESVRTVAIAYTKYSVSFDNNGGSGTMDDASGAVPANLPSSTFTRDGYVFAGWNDDPLGLGAAYTEGEEYAFDADTTLYAQWTVDPSAQSGDGSSDSANLPKTGVDVSASVAFAGGLLSAGMLSFVVVIRRRRVS